MTEIRLKISGMSCGGCVNSVQQALAEVDAVDTVSVDLQSARASVTSESGSLDPNTLVSAVKLAGFQAEIES
ncbi:MAG: heavy-metal-associated domain-containing protein [Candidatus Zixiibacteriota bacterium]